MCHHFTWRWYCWCLFSWWSSGLERMMHNQRSLWQGHGSCFFSSWLGQMPCVSLTKPLFRQTKHFPHFLSMLPQLWMNSGPLSMPGGEVALPPCSFLIWKKTEPGRQNQQALVGSAEHFWRLRVLWGIRENWGGQNPVFKKKKSVNWINWRLLSLMLIMGKILGQKIKQMVDQHIGRVIPEVSVHDKGLSLCCFH